MMSSKRYRELKRQRDADGTLGLLYTPIDELDDDGMSSLNLLSTTDDERESDDDDGSLGVMHDDEESWWTE